MSTIRFEQRTDKTNRQGQTPIRVVYQIRGQRKYYPTTLKCLPTNWNAKDQQAIFIDKKAAKKLEPKLSYETFLTETQVREFNSKLRGYLTDIENVEKRFSLDKIAYTPQMVIDALDNIRQPEAIKDDPGKSVIAFIHQFVQDSKISHKPGTLKVYSGLAEHLKAFEKLTRKKATFEKIDIPFLRAFHSSLSESKTISKGEKQVAIKPMNNITSAKQMSTLKTLLNYARTIYKINVNPDYRDYKVARKDSDFEVITLTNDEFQTLYEFDLSNHKKLAQVRDVFCFSCATGLRYSDLAQLKREHIRDDAIKMTAAKTSQRLEIPLNRFSAAILKKYETMHRPLPIISNQKTNDYLKELCELAEINTPVEIVREYGIKKETNIYKKFELISIHTGRKTFTTLSLEKGIAAQEVMAITGHTTYKSFKRYVDITSKRKQTVMAKAWGTVNDNNLKAV
jgi:integrase